MSDVKDLIKKDYSSGVMLREIYKNERGAWKQALFSYAINGVKKSI